MILSVSSLLCFYFLFWQITLSTSQHSACVTHFTSITVEVTPLPKQTTPSPPLHLPHTTPPNQFPNNIPTQWNNIFPQTHTFRKCPNNSQKTQDWVRGGFKKWLNLFNAHLTPTSQAERWITKIQKFYNLFYAFIIFIITKFGENFEEKIDICFF